MPVKIEKENKKTGEVSEKMYETVPERIHRLRAALSVTDGWGLNTEMTYDGDIVRCKASLINPAGKIVATGHAEEDRNSGYINKTSAVENCETSALGRCVFAAGFGGGEFCSVEELANAIRRQEELKAAGDGKKKDKASDKKADSAQNTSTPAKPETYESLPEIEGVTYEKKGNIVIATGKTFDRKALLKDAGFTFTDHEGGKKAWILQAA